MPESRASRPRQARARIRRSSAEVRQLLIDAAFSEFSAKGYVGATLQEIAASAGVGVSAVYHHFESKAELFRQAMLQPFLSFLDEFTEVWNAQLDQPWDEFRLMRALISELYDNLRPHRRVLIELAAARDHLDPMVLVEIRKASNRMFLELRAIGEEEANRRKFFTAEGIELTIRLVVGMVTSMAVFDDWLLPSFPTSMPRDDLLDHITSYALWGLALRPPDTDRS